MISCRTNRICGGSLVKAIFLLLIYALLTVGIYAQAQPAPTPPADGLEELYLAKDDGTGKAGDVVTTFSTSDIPIHCIVQLDSVRIASIKMNLVAVKVPGVKPETKVVTTSYTTKANQNQVNFTGKPDGVWTAGRYRVDIFLDGKLARSYDFLIEKATGEKVPAADDKAVNSFQPKQPAKPRPRNTKKN
jgi:hypothetical protein